MFVTSIPPPDRNGEQPGSDPPEKEPEKRNSSAAGDAAAKSQIGPLPGQNLEDFLGRLKKSRPPGAAPSKWETAGEKGLAGERAVACVLERELRGSPTVRLYSQTVARPVGDIDAIVVGPGGVTVIDSKSWSGEVTVDRDQILRQNGTYRHQVVDNLVRRQRRAVKLALIHARPELRNTPVQEIVCLADEESRPVEALTGGVVLCGAVAAAEIANREGALSSSDIDQIRATLADRLPKITSDEITGHVNGGKTIPHRAAEPGLATPRISTPNRRRLTPQPARRSSAAAPRRAQAVPKQNRAKRQRPRRRSAGALVVAGLLVVIALELLHYAARPDTGPTVSLTSQAGRSVVYLTAPAGDRVAVGIKAGTKARYIKLTGTGTRQSWSVPRNWSRSAPITVSACTTNPAGTCAGPTVQASDLPRK